MKKEKANAPAQKQSVNDFAHRLTIQLTEQHYVDYAMTHSQDQIQKGRKRAILLRIASGAVMALWCSLSRTPEV